MASYNATYTHSGSAQPATVVLLPDKVSIQFTTAEGERTLHWYYSGITPATGNRQPFTYTAYPPQTLEVLDAALADALIMRLHGSKKQAVKKRNRTALTLLAGCVLFFSVVYFLLLPWAATALAARVPISYERELGGKLFGGMKNEFRIDERKSAQATAFFKAMHVPSAYDIKITVVKSEVANAFAMPGGYIVIYDTLLNRLSSYPQLAALLAHEFVHIEARHSLKSMFRQLSVTLLFSVFMGDAGAAGSAVLSHMDRLKSLSYSRSLESEADAEGVQLLAERHIDGAGFIGLFRVLQSEPGIQQPEWTSSHPNLERRIRNIRENKTYQQQQPTTDTTLQQLFLSIKKVD